ncbi:MAG: hypothetical protein JSS25_01460 [Proteobacteria bacterium]|nr:hypothetical protein [Pseudomonadota bacterium]
MITALDCLYGSLLDAGLFDTFLKQFAEVAGADSASLFDFDLARPDAMRFINSAADETANARFTAIYPTTQGRLWWERSERDMMPGAVINGIDYASTSEIKATQYYRELLEPLNILHSAAICAVMRPDMQCLLTVHRSEDRGAFDADSIAVLREFAPHWVRYKLLEQRMSAQKHDLRGHSSLAVFELGPTFDVRKMNPSAEHCIAAGWLQRGPDATLRMHDARSQALWTSCQRQAMSAAAPPPAVPVYGHHSEVVAYAALRPQVDSSLTPRRLLFVRPLQPIGVHADLTATLRTSCGLTASEAAFAIALRRSETLADAAQSLGITVGTARQRLQEIFEKMDLHRQAELFQALDSLAELNDHLHHRTEPQLA